MYYCWYKFHDDHNLKKQTKKKNTWFLPSFHFDRLSWKILPFEPLHFICPLSRSTLNLTVTIPRIPYLIDPTKWSFWLFINFDFIYFTVLLFIHLFRFFNYNFNDKLQETTASHKVREMEWVNKCIITWKRRRRRRRRRQEIYDTTLKVKLLMVVY